MRSTRTLATLALSTVLLTVAAQGGTFAGASTAAVWHLQSSPSYGQSSHLISVTTTSSSNAWAVGMEITNGGDFQTLVEHYDGHTWTRQTSPNPEPFNTLNAVKAVSATNVWAVGQYVVNGGYRGLIFHYDGSQWTLDKRVSGVAGFVGVGAPSASNVWAVGSSNANGGTYIEHFDGSTWTHVASPKQQTDYLYSVSASGSSNAWAVGAEQKNGLLSPIIVHDGGSGWGFQTVPATSGQATLYGVSANSATDVWAVGVENLDAPRTTALGDVLILHWNGVKWKRVTPSSGTAGVLHGVKAVTSSDVWAVGEQEEQGQIRTLIEHYDGVSWHPMGSPNGAGAINLLLGVASSSGANSFAVGYSDDKTLALRCAC
jgi:hypothetical protein